MLLYITKINAFKWNLKIIYTQLLIHTLVILIAYTNENKIKKKKNYITKKKKKKKKKKNYIAKKKKSYIYI